MDKKRSAGVTMLGIIAMFTGAILSLQVIVSLPYKIFPALNNIYDFAWVVLGFLFKLNLAFFYPFLLLRQVNAVAYWAFMILITIVHFLIGIDLMRLQRRTFKITTILFSTLGIFFLAWIIIPIRRYFYIESIYQGVISHWLLPDYGDLYNYYLIIACFYIIFVFLLIRPKVKERFK